MKINLSTLINNWSRSITIPGFTASVPKDMLFKSSIARVSPGNDYIASCVNRYSNAPSDVSVILDPENSASFTI